MWTFWKFFQIGYQHQLKIYWVMLKLVKNWQIWSNLWIFRIRKTHSSMVFKHFPNARDKFTDFQLKLLHLTLIFNEANIQLSVDITWLDIQPECSGAKALTLNLSLLS